VYGYPAGEGTRRGGGCRQKCMGIPLPAEWGMPTNRRIGIWRQGRGEASPLPVSLSPNGDIHHGPLHGDKPEKTRARFSTRYRHALPPPRRGGGGAPKARVGWGLPAEEYGYLLAKARAGRGCRQRCMGILLRRRGRGGGCRRSVWLSPWREKPAKSMATVSPRCRFSPAGSARDRFGPGCVRAGGGPPEENM